LYINGNPNQFGLDSLIKITTTGGGQNGTFPYVDRAFLELQSNTTQGNYSFNMISVTRDVGTPGETMYSFINGSGSAYFAGKVGIGTASPVSNLHVYGGSNSSFIELQVASNSYTSQIRLNQGGSLDSYIGLTNTSWFDIYNSAGTALNGFRFTANNTQLVTFLGNGNVGIGVTNPAAPFNIMTTFSSAGITSSSTLWLNALTSLSGSTSGGSYTGSVYQAGDNGTQSLLLYAGGTYPNGAGIIQSKDILSVRNYPQRLLLNPDGGPVGIGTTSPGYTLDVSGSARVTTLRSSVTTSYVITNNATQNYSIAGLAAGVYIVLINTAGGSGNVSGTGAGIYGFAYVFLGSTGTVTTVTQIVNYYCAITGSGSNITFQNGLNATYSGNVTLTCIAGNN